MDLFKVLGFVHLRYKKMNKLMFLIYVKSILLPKYSPHVTNALPCFAITFEPFLKASCMPRDKHAQTLNFQTSHFPGRRLSPMNWPVLRNQRGRRMGLT